MNRKEKIIYYSDLLAKKIGLTLFNKEFNYGKGIGRADNHCYIGDWIVIFELEFSQRHPEMNVMKVWPYLISNPNKKIFLIHHITNNKAVSPNRIGLSNFIAQKIEQDLNERFKYFQIINEFDEQSRINLKEIFTKMKIN